MFKNNQLKENFKDFLTEWELIDKSFDQLNVNLKLLILKIFENKNSDIKNKKINIENSLNT